MAQFQSFGNHHNYYTAMTRQIEILSLSFMFEIDLQIRMDLDPGHLPIFHGEILIYSIKEANASLLFFP